MKKSFVDIVEGKKVLFITTKNIDYIRNVQEINLLKKLSADTALIFSSKKGYLGRIIEIWVKLLKCNIDDRDIIFIGFSPQLILPIFSRKFNKKVVISDFFISIYDTLILDRKKFKEKGVISKISHWLDARTIAIADVIITDTGADADFFIKEFEGDRNKFETLYIEADAKVYFPRVQCKRSELKDKFIVLYFGSILPLQGVDVVLDAIRMLKSENKIYFQVIGPIPDKYCKPIQDNVEYINWLGQEELAEYIANADLCLAGHFNEKIEKANRTIPGKAYIYAAMGKKMVLGDSLANREIFEETENYTFSERGNSRMLVDVIFKFVAKNEVGK